MIDHAFVVGSSWKAFLLYFFTSLFLIVCHIQSIFELRVCTPRKDAHESLAGNRYFQISIFMNQRNRRPICVHKTCSGRRISRLKFQQPFCNTVSVKMCIVFVSVYVDPSIPIAKGNVQSFLHLFLPSPFENVDNIQNMSVDTWKQWITEFYRNGLQSSLLKGSYSIVKRVGHE